MKYNVYVILGVLILSGLTESAIAAITSVSVTPTSAKSGTIFKFTANLDAPLTAGNKVKIDLGKGLASMTGKGINYSLSRAIYTEGKQTYNVGIYNAKNVLQGKLSSGNYNIESLTPVSIDKPKLPTIDVVNAFQEDDFHVGFAITLSAPLPSKEYRVKIEADDKKINEDLSYYADTDFKNGTNYHMISDGKDFYQRAYLGEGINSSSSGIYSVGIYEAKGNLVSNRASGNFKATAPKDNKPPTLEVNLPNNVIFGKNMKAKIVSKDENADIVSVKVSVGDSYMTRNIVSKDGTLNLDYSYKSVINKGSHVDSTIVAYDQFGAKTEYEKNVFLRSDEPKKINISSNSYTKISNDGFDLPETSSLGSKPNDWGCTRDNKTGFVWEIKLDDDSFRSRYNVITWYKSPVEKDPNKAGFVDMWYEDSVKYAGNKCNGSWCDTDSESYVEEMNAKAVCGITSWTMPMPQQLNTLVYCSDGKYNPLDTALSTYQENFICSGNVTTKIIYGTTYYTTKVIVDTPTIDTVYFPDVEKGISSFMSSKKDKNPFSKNNGQVLSTDFSNGYNRWGFWKYNGRLRLVGCQAGWHLDESNNVTDVFLGIVSTTENKCVKDN